jgi:nucleoporin NDC1
LNLKTTTIFTELQATAFWELSIITSRFPTRRQTLYSELDRNGGSTWSQIQAICLDEINGISARINPAPETPQPASEAPAGRQTIAAPLKNDLIFAKPQPPKTFGQKAEALLGPTVRKHGNSPGATPLKNALEYSSQKLLPASTRAEIAPAHLQEKASGYLVKFVHSPVGYPFRKPFYRRVNAVIFGAGDYQNSTVVINAVNALTKLVVESVKEDTYAQVSKSVPTIIRAYASAITVVEGFVSGLESHWSDIEGRQPILEVEVLLGVLKEGLEDVFGAFGEYLDGLGMGAAEAGKVKGLLGKRAEMEKISGLS